MSEILSQQDPRWANIKIGNSAYYIWAKGCFITEIAQAIGSTPDVVNEKLTAVNGYADDGTGQIADVIWDKIKEAFPGWSATYVSGYDNAAVLKNLEEGNKVLVEVSAAPIGGDGLHCVEYIGGGQCYNCWPNPGVQVPTSTFPDVKAYVILQKTAQATTDSGEVTPAPSDPVTTTPPANDPGATQQGSTESTASSEPVAGEDVSKLPAGWPATYQGLDMTNLKSVQTAIDTWAAVAHGEYVSAEEYSKLIEQITSALGIQADTPITSIVDNIRTLKADFAKSVQNSVTPAPSQIEGQGPAVGVAQIPHTVTNLAQNEKEGLLNSIKGLLGL